MTLRDATDWFKKVAWSNDVGYPNEIETAYINERWSVIAQAIATREGVPVGIISYMLHELAVSEHQLRERAVTDAQEAMV